MSVSKQFDLTREEIVQNFRDRINKGSGHKLKKKERECLTLIFLDACGYASLIA